LRSNGTSGVERQDVCGASSRGFTHRFAGLAPPPLWGRLARVASLEERLARIPALRTQALYMMVRAQRPPDAPSL